MTKPKRTPEQIAEEHWAWLGSLLHKIYVDAMIHGMKHGKKKGQENAE